MSRPDVQEIRSATVQQLMSETFFRDPMRPLHYDPAVFYAPADGFILYSHVVDPAKRIVEVKGRNLTTRELLQDPDYSARSLVVGIFLTFYDVHVNRMPTDGYVHFRRPSASGTESMVTLEAGILKHGIVNHDDMAYAFTNERVVTRVYNPYFKQSYYLVQIADREVDTISLLAQEDEYLSQGERFGTIRFGSQVDLIIPLDLRCEFTSLVGDRVLYHVEAGIDPVVKAAVR